MKNILVYFLLTLLPVSLFSQIDTAFVREIKALDTLDILRLDTTAAPDDAVTRKIRHLLEIRNETGIQKIMEIKISEDQQKDTARRDFYKSLRADLYSGKTNELIGNMLVSIYRRTFTEPEIDELIRFYQTPAGQKTDKRSLLILIESIKGAEKLMQLAAKNLGTKKEEN